MQKLAKRFSVFMAAVMTLSMMLNFVVTAPAKAATVYPQVQYAQEPQLEYTVGDRVQFNLYTPNYGGRVQYRVVLWNDETKSYKDLWTNTPDRYYDKWMPYGNNIFTLGWVINEPGHYRITIYAKRAGVPNNETYLKGFNCDSYMESDSFVVKAKEVVKTPDVASDTLAIAVKSSQMVVGQEYTVKADVKKAGVKVIFNIDAPADSMNKDLVGEALSDANGIAEYKYTRNSADADFVTAYVSAAPAVRANAKVYWGITPILTIAATDKDDAAEVTNGSVKRYKVTLKNPITGQPMKNKELKVMLKENIDTAELRSTAVVTNDFNAERITPYQRTNNIIPGGLNEKTVSLVTNDNGEATFTLTGYNTKATPIVFYDAYKFYNELPYIQTWLINGQLPNVVVMPDSSQFETGYAGNYNGRLDATELQVEPKQVSFVLVGYKFTATMDGDKYVAVSNFYFNDHTSPEALKAACENYSLSGRIYTVTVNKPDDKPFAGGLLHVRIEQLFDAVGLSNHTEARLFAFDEDDEVIPAPQKELHLLLNSDGEATFMVASPTLNDIATPRVWIDQDTPFAYDGYTRNNVYQEGEPTKLLDTLYFVNRAVSSNNFDAAIGHYEAEPQQVVTLVGNKDADKNKVNLKNYWTKYEFSIVDQNNQSYVPVGANVLVTYTIANIGGNPVTIRRPDDLDNVKIDGYRMFYEEDFSLDPGETVTISGEADDLGQDLFQIFAYASTDAKITVNAHAVTTRSNSDSWWQPSNTMGAVLADATVTTSWVDYTDAAPFEKVGTLEFYDKANDFIVIKSGTTYYKVSYADSVPNLYLETAYHMALTHTEFEKFLKVGTSMYVFLGANGTEIHYMK